MNWKNNAESDSQVALYQSLSGTSEQSQYDEINARKTFPSSSSSSNPSSYIEIRDAQSDVSLPNYDEIKDQSFTPNFQQTTTTANSLYASKGDTLKHPTLHLNQLSPIPEAPVDDVKEKSCRCSSDAILCTSSLLVILLSVVAITLVLLLWFNVISYHQTRPVLLSNNNRIIVSYSSPSSIVPQPSPTPQNVCDCSSSLPSFDLNAINESIARITLELQQLKINEMSINVTRQRLNDLLLQVKSINDSIQQLRPQSNYRQPQLTGLNLSASFGANISSGCETTVASFCTITSFSAFPHCEAANLNFMNNDKVLINFSCRLHPVNSDTVLSNGSASIIFNHQSADPEDDLFDSAIGCSCYSLVPSECRYIATYCPYQQPVPINTILTT